MANIALDGDALRRDRQRYADLLAQAEQQIAAWNERADHLQQAVDGFDHLLALAGDDAVLDGGVPRGLVAGRGAAPPAPARSVKASHAPAPEAGQPSAGGDAQPERPPVAAGSGPGGAARASERTARVASAGAERAPKVARATTVRKAPAAAVASARPASAAPVTPAAPEPVVPPEAETPKGTDALRLVFESEAGRTWTLAELIAALGSRGWLPTSRRPEEGVRISLKRLAERGGAVRTDDGRWRLAGPGPERPPGAGNPGPERSPGAGTPGPERPPGAGNPRARAAPRSGKPRARAAPRSGGDLARGGGTAGAHGSGGPGRSRRRATGGRAATAARRPDSSPGRHRHRGLTAPCESAHFWSRESAEVGTRVRCAGRDPEQLR